MYFLKALLAAFVFCICFGSAAGQTANEVLARVAGRDVTAKELSPHAAEFYAQRAEYIAERRKRFVEKLAVDLVLEAEAVETGIPTDAMIRSVRAKAAEPNANANASDARQLQAVRDILETLEKKHKVVYGKAVDSQELKPGDVLVTVGTKSVTAKEFNDLFKIALADAEAEIAEHLLHEVEEVVYQIMLESEANARGIEAGDLIAAEITKKMRDYSADEYLNLTAAFREMLNKKYEPVFLLKVPPPSVQVISADDDPFLGNANAPVTIVMFSDLRCPACAAMHPLVKGVAGEFAGSVRFVVRDFPLVLIHAMAFDAALAANAAARQGKYFEYVELVYLNQKMLHKSSFERFASELGLNEKRFEIDFNDEKAAAEIRRDIADGERHGVSATPTIFVNGVKIRHISESELRKAIETALGKKQ